MFDLNVALNLDDCEDDGSPSLSDSSSSFIQSARGRTGPEPRNSEEYDDEVEEIAQIETASKHQQGTSLKPEIAKTAGDKEKDRDQQNKGASDGETEPVVSPTNDLPPLHKSSFDAMREGMEMKLKSMCVFPELGQAYIFYCEYARLKGFSVRKGDQKYIGSTKELRWKDFLCSASGLPVDTAYKGRVAKYRKLIKRTNCAAKIRLHPDHGHWKVTMFVDEHNHPLVSPDQSFLLRSSRHLTPSRKSIIEAMRSVGIPLSVALGFMEVQCGGPENVGFLRKDAYDHIRRARGMAGHVIDGDAIALLEYFNRKSNEEPSYFWKVKYSLEGRLLHFFMRDSRCYTDYCAFGDVVSVDTTFKTNKYNLSCAPFVGLNHHAANVMFGIAFLSDEKQETFEWLFETFLEAMLWKPPAVVFSDQCRALMNAIDSKFPSATHRLCQWHVNNNATKHFGLLNKNVEFKRMWHKCMNGVETEEDFERLWRRMMDTHVHEEHNWLEDIYVLRKRWASVFSQTVFTAGMRATTRSEGTNRVLKALNRSSNTLFEFATAYDVVQSKWRASEAAEDTACLWLPGQFVNNQRMLVQAATVYTRTIYKKFEYQLTEALNVEVDSNGSRSLGDGKIEFKATRSGNTTAPARTIVYDPVNHEAWCSCRTWEGQGILCRHILRVYIVRNVSAIPNKFILKRWMKSAKRVDMPPSNPLPVDETTNNKVEQMDFVNMVMRTQYDIAMMSQESVIGQKFIVKCVESQKEGLLEVLKGGVPPPLPKPGDDVSKFQFRNPNKVKDRRFKENRNEQEASKKNKKPRRKGPGICQKSRKSPHNPDRSSDVSAHPTDYNEYYHESPMFHATQ